MLLKSKVYTGWSAGGGDKRHCTCGLTALPTAKWCFCPPQADSICLCRSGSCDSVPGSPNDPSPSPDAQAFVCYPRWAGKGVDASHGL